MLYDVGHSVVLNLAYLSIVLQVTRDIVTCFFHEDSCDIHLNHGDLLDAIWSWIGVKVEHRLKVAEVCYLSDEITKPRLLSF